MINRLLYGYSKLFGILGNPVEHSLSPFVHSLLLQHPDYIEKAGIYIPIQAKKQDIESTLATLNNLNFVGINVTSPYKAKVIPFLNEISPLSKKIQSVNTIVWKNKKSYGTSTDGIGFVKGFEQEGFSFHNKNVTILGTGGAARAVFAALEEQHCQSILNVSRHSNTSHNLFSKVISYSQYSDYQKQIDIIVNCTPLGMGKNSSSPLTLEQLESHQCVYDLVYGKETPILKLAKKKGITSVTGLGMLIYQAIESFKIWTEIDYQLIDEFWVNFHKNISQ